MPAHTTRIRLLVTAVLAALLINGCITGCKDGTGVRDEGPSGVSPTATAPAPAHSTP